MSEFTTIDYLLTFPGMLAAVILMTQFAKKLLNISGTKNIERVLYFWCVVFAVIAAIFNGNFSSYLTILSTVLVWLVNSVIIWWAALKAFEKATGADKATDGTFILDQTDPDTDRFRIDLGDNLEGLRHKSTVKLVVDTSTPLNPMD